MELLGSTPGRRAAAVTDRLEGERHRALMSMRDLENTAVVAASSRESLPLHSSSARPHSMPAELTSILSALGAFEWVALSYLAFSSFMILWFARNLAHPWK